MRWPSTLPRPSFWPRLVPGEITVENVEDADGLFFYWPDRETIGYLSYAAVQWCLDHERESLIPRSWIIGVVEHVYPELDQVLQIANARYA
jgi:hypothetical protein